MGTDQILLAVRDAFLECTLPPRPFIDEDDLRLALFPAMRAVVGGGITIHDEHEAPHVPDFIPAEQIRPDGEARLEREIVALELKLLRGRRNADAGDVHRGLGQCIAYASADRYQASALLIVHAAVIRRKRPRGPALGLPLLATPGTICIARVTVRPNGAAGAPAEQPLAPATSGCRTQARR
jgi:hypothetical protein